NLLAVNERRHEAILYIPLALSIRDLRETIVERLKTIYGNPLPSDINIPSDEWIHLQFCPTNITTTRAMYYTGRFNVKFKVQAQMLQKNSENAHYCAALFHYLREFCEDVAVYTSVRNRCSMVAQESNLAATDHDFAKLSLTLS
ncbi:17720_t:CDS:2, partial [Racocetra persica]